MTEQITKEEFIERFVSHMKRQAGQFFDDGYPIEKYAREAAPTYWDEPHQRSDGPEECADADMSYWGED